MEKRIIIEEITNDDVRITLKYTESSLSDERYGMSLTVTRPSEPPACPANLFTRSELTEIAEGTEKLLKAIFPDKKSIV